MQVTRVPFLGYVDCSHRYCYAVDPLHLKDAKKKFFLNHLGLFQDMVSFRGTVDIDHSQMICVFKT